MTYTCPTCGQVYTKRLRPIDCEICGEMGFNFKNDFSPLSDVCEWCEMTYPAGEWDYYSVVVFRTNHVICKDCYDQLKLVKHVK